jgi:lactoylglutathione lyase
MCTSKTGIGKIVTGIQHIGLPVRDMTKTLEFYQKLGFEILWQTVLNGAPVCFLKGMGITVEAYQSNETAGCAGAINHIALNTTDIDEVWDVIGKLGLIPDGESIQPLPFFDNGVKFFTIEGPDAEKIEFNQILQG